MDNCEFWGKLPKSYDKETLSLTLKFTNGNVVLLNGNSLPTNANKNQVQVNKSDSNANTLTKDLKMQQAELNEKYQKETDSEERKKILLKISEITKKLKNKVMED